MSTPIERAAVAAWPHYFTGDRNFNAARDEVLGIRARAALEAALDVDELARVVFWSDCDPATEDAGNGMWARLLERYPDGTEWHRVARAIREHLLTSGPVTS